MPKPVRFQDAQEKAREEIRKKYMLLLVLSRAKILDEADQREFEVLQRQVNVLNTALHRAGATSLGFTGALELASKIGRYLATQR